MASWPKYRLAPGKGGTVIGPRKRPADFNARAKSVVADAVGDRKSEPASVLSGRKGGLKGGPARAAKLSAERRSEIAKQARAARARKAQQNDLADQELTRKILENPRVRQSFEMMAEQLRATPRFVPASEDEYRSVLDRL